MGSYGVIKEALLVKEDSTGKATIVQKLVPSTVNGLVINFEAKDGFTYSGEEVSLHSICHGGAFGLSEGSNAATLNVAVFIPGFGTKPFNGSPFIENVNGVGKCVKCTPDVPDPNGHYTHLCLLVESPGDAFVAN